MPLSTGTVSGKPKRCDYTPLTPVEPNNNNKHADTKRSSNKSADNGNVDDDEDVEDDVDDDDNDATDSSGNNTTIFLFLTLSVQSKRLVPVTCPSFGPRSLFIMHATFARGKQTLSNFARLACLPRLERS